VLEVRSTVAILDDGLTIDDCRLAAEVGSGTDEGGETVSPIVSIAREDTPLPSLKQHLAAIAIVFDFVNPVLPLWRLIDRGSKLWLDKSQAGGYAGHGALVDEARTVTPGLNIKKPRAGGPGLLVLIFGQAALGGTGKPVHLANQLLAGANRS
jgi:hypothetical protein